MQLYFSPLACSMASRIALYEANAPARFIEVDPKTKRTLEGEDFLAINPLGLVPVIRTDEGELLTENAAILQYIADRYPAAGLAPRSHGKP
jgi:glutathione S-transferase